MTISRRTLLGSAAALPLAGRARAQAANTIKIGVLNDQSGPYRDTGGLRTPADPGYPVQLAGVARDSSGTAIGGVRHQLRDLDGGFEAWLTVEFPRLTPSRMIRQHRWHLACEFSNWIEFADGDRATLQDGAS